MAYFQNVKTKNDLKRQFRELAKVFHPDLGGDAEIMKAINCEYEILAASLPEEKAQQIEIKPPFRTFSCSPYRRSTSGGANLHLLRLASPRYSHKDLCLAVRTLYTFGRQNRRDDTTITQLYWEMCEIFDPGQSKPYQDYYFNKKSARKSVEFVGGLLKSIFRPQVWAMLKLAKERLAG